MKKKINSENLFARQLANGNKQLESLIKKAQDNKIKIWDCSDKGVNKESYLLFSFSHEQIYLFSSIIRKSLDLENINVLVFLKEGRYFVRFATIHELSTELFELLSENLDKTTNFNSLFEYYLSFVNELIKANINNLPLLEINKIDNEIISNLKYSLELEDKSNDFLEQIKSNSLDEISNFHNNFSINQEDLQQAIFVLKSKVVLRKRKKVN